MPHSILRILVADDEKIARIALVDMLKELESEIDILEVSDGAMLLEKIPDFRPHLAFVDIRMPLIDGLNAIRKARKISPRTQWIILSGFDEFEYARKAVSLQVFQYLLKPVRPEKLKTVVNKAYAAWSRAAETTNALFELEIQTFLEREPYDTAVICERRTRTFDFYSAVIIFDTKNGVTLENVSKKDTAYLRKKISGILGSQFQTAVFGSNRNEISLVFAFEPPSDNLASIIETLDEISSRFRTDSHNPTIFISDRSSGVKELHTDYKAIKKFSSLRIALGLGQIIREDAYRSIKDIAALERFCRTVDNALRHYFSGNQIELSRVLSSEFFLNSICTYWNNKEYSENISSFLSCKFGFPVSTTSSPKALFTLSTDIHSRTVHRNELRLRYINLAMEYLAEHYREDIGVNTVAPLLGITPNYLSSLFRKKTGKRFVHYLSDLRIEKSRELLENTDLFIKDIANEVGYRSVRHFTRTFELHEGCHPSTYRKHILNTKL